MKCTNVQMSTAADSQIVAHLSETLQVLKTQTQIGR